MTSFFWSNLSWFVLVGMLVTISLLVVAWKVYRSLPGKEKAPAVKKPEVVDLSKMGELQARVEEYRAAYARIGEFLGKMERKD